MKKIIIFVFSAFLLSACGDHPAIIESERVPFTDVTHFDYNGHKYIKFFYIGSIVDQSGVVHDPDCPCHNK